MKDVVAVVDVNLNRKEVIKFCKQYDLYYDEYTNVNGGRYIQIILCGIESKYIDVYYKCLDNKILYKAKLNKQKDFCIKQILNVIERVKKELI